MESVGYKGEILRRDSHCLRVIILNPASLGDPFSEIFGADDIPRVDILCVNGGYLDLLNALSNGVFDLGVSGIP